LKTVSTDVVVDKKKKNGEKIGEKLFETQKY
jgi:hypothetical protein